MPVVGFGTLTYLRIENNKGEVYVSFLLGKARVTLLKQITIPCLTAAVLVVQVDQKLRAELELQLDQSVFWTDSTSVLKYIKMKTSIFAHL